MTDILFKYSPYPKPPLTHEWRLRCGSISFKAVTLGDDVVWLDGRVLCWHNLYHIELSLLERIDINKSAVSGIHGFYSSMFHRQTIQPEYDGILDELRVAIHEWFTRRSLYNTLKLLNWSYWMLRQGINPIVTLWRHYRSLRHWPTCEQARFQKLQEWADRENMTLALRPIVESPVLNY